MLMTDINELVQTVVNDSDYSLDAYGCDVDAIIETAVKEVMPQSYNETDESNFRLALRAELEAQYDEFVSPDDCGDCVLCGKCIEMADMVSGYCDACYIKMGGTLK